MRYFLFLFLFSPALSAIAQLPDTPAGLDAHFRRVIAQARQADRLIRASRVPQHPGPGLARQWESAFRSERRFRDDSLLRGRLDAPYFRAQHEFLDASSDQLRQLEQLYADLVARRVP